VSGEGLKLLVGHKLKSSSGEAVYYWPGNTALSQINVGILGNQGTGKTQLLKSIIAGLRQSSRESQGIELPILIFDYERDFQDDEFLTAVGGRVVPPHQIPLNVLTVPDITSVQARYERARAFTDVVGKIFPNIGQKQQNNLSETIMQLFEEIGGPPTLDEILHTYREGGADGGVVAVLNAFSRYQVFSSNRTDCVSFEDFLGDQVVVIDLSSLKTDQSMKNSIVALFLNVYYEFMITRKKWPYVGESPQLRCVSSYLVVDEASNIMEYHFEVLKQLLLQGREFGIGVILSSQFLSHFNDGDTNYGEPVKTWFVHQVPTLSIKDLQDLGLAGVTTADVETIKALEIFQSYFLSYGAEGQFVREVPFFERGR
jgi:DNA phosphorothioation-dependent restriction protein DptH